MRQIKFRGIDKVTGKPVYGYYNPFGKGGDIPMIDVGQSCTEIQPDSLSQLVGLDRNGAEVYEGDKVRNPDTGATFAADMRMIYTIRTYELVKE